jgi:hypothetical protein
MKWYAKKKGRFQREEDQKIREKLADADQLPHAALFAECDALIAKGVAEVQSHWTDKDFEERARWARSRATTHMIEVHHTDQRRVTWRDAG